MLILLLLQTVAAVPTGSVALRARYDACLDLAIGNPDAARAEAERWAQADGGFLARQCLGVAQANARDWPAAATTFEQAAKDALKAGDGRSATYWAQAGNAWLAAGDAEKAGRALDFALAGSLLRGEPRGQAHADRARVRVAAGEPESARADLDQAEQLAPKDPVVWLLSATLARRMQDLPRAQADIKQALALTPEDAPVQLEAGNIAAVAGDAAGARAGWEHAIRIAPGTPTAESARAALKRLGD